MMLQSLRENLKGAVAVFVLLIFIVPLVLFGVEQLFVGSVGGTEAASVNGESINARELQREMFFDKQRLQQQFDLSPTDPQLDDSNLRGPALERLVRRYALFQAAQQGGMGVEKEVLWQDIIQIEAFQVDGKFNYDVFKDRISNFYTPATFLDASAKDYLLRQLNSGLTGSSFTTAADLALLAGITQQKRDFFAVTIPESTVGDVEVTDVEVQAFYDANSDNYLEPEKVSLEFIELDLESLAKQNEPSEADVRSAYDMEVSEFEAQPRYQVAHILLEQDDSAEADVAQVQAKLAEGVAFAELAEQFSDDLGSKSNGGELGELVEDAYPSKFVEAAKKLKEGEVSGPVVTDAGTHFIKVLEISDVNPPAFAERKEAIANQLARQNAREDFVAGIARMDELTFGADGLQQAAEALNLQVQATELFTRAGGEGIAANKQVVDAAFADDVLAQKQNSRVLELVGDRAVVLRLQEHQPAALQPLDEVAEAIRSQLQAQKTAELLQAKAAEVEQTLRQSDDVEAAVKALGYDYQAYSEAKRNNFEISRALLNKAFELPRPLNQAVVFGSVKTAEGYSLVGLTGVNDGSVDELSEQERNAIRSQLAFQFGQMEMTNFEQAVVDGAEVDLNN